MWGQLILLVGACAVHCRMDGSIPGLNLVDASSTHLQSWQPQITPDIVSSPLGTKLLGTKLLEITV